MMTEEQEDKLIDQVCVEFDQLDKSVDSLEDVKRIFNECVGILQKNNIESSESADDEDFVEPEEGEVILFNIETSIDGEETELEFNFEYTLLSGKYLIFSDLDFHNAAIDAETTDTE